MGKSKYGLTNKEKEWLKKRRPCHENPCVDCLSINRSDCRYSCYALEYYDKKLAPDYIDALMFESRVKIKLISMDYNDVPCAHSMKALCPRKGGSFPGCGNWCLLREAELMVEAEMEREERMVRNERKS